MEDAGGPFAPDETWDRSVIKYAQWDDVKDRNFANNGVIVIGSHVEIIIPKTANAGGKDYINPIDWNKLPEEQKLEKWTLSVGDYVFFGDAPEITDAYTMKQAKDNFKSCAIKAIDDLSNQPILPHWEVAGQ
jgi:hypothetical protein